MSQLREYLVYSYNSDRDAGIYPALAVNGNFYYTVSVENLTAPGDNHYDIPVIFSFDDDQGRISARPGEGGNRQYQRLSLRPDVIPVTDLNDYKIRVILGEGTLYSDRTDDIVPKNMVCYRQVIPSGVATQFTYGGDLKPSIKEIRMCIPSSEANGLTFGEDNTVTYLDGAWLERGVTEYIQYAGDLWFYNNGGAPVTITFAVILRQDA